MRLHPRCVVVLMLLLMPTVAQAHGHVWDFSFAPTWAEGSSLWGGRFSVGITNKAPSSKDLSWLIDVTNVKGKDGSDDIIQLAYLGGLRYAVFGRQRTDKNIVMVHGLVGRIYKQTGATGAGEWAGSVGGAFERVLSDSKGWAARVQVEHSFVNNIKGYTQASVGVVKLFN